MTSRALGLACFAALVAGCSGDATDTTTVTSRPASTTSTATSAPSTTSTAVAVTTESGRQELDPETQCPECRRPPAEFTALPGAEAVYGELDGAVYHVEMPADWGGTLLLWGHGFLGLGRGPDGFDPNLGFGPSAASVGLPEEIRAYAIENGIAWGASTYRANGYVPALGVDELLRVKDLVTERFGAPQRTYVLGESMGGATAQLMAQEFPDEVDGAVALCGALGNVAVLDYLAAWHGVAAWALGGPPAGLSREALADWVAGLGDPRQPTPAGERFIAVIRALTGGDRPGFETGMRVQWEANFAFGATLWQLVDQYEAGATYANPDAHAPFDTTGIVFGAVPAAGIDVDALNAEVVRFAADPAARANPAFGVATGELEDPLLAIKDTGDLFTPISLEAAYRAVLEAAGNSDLFVDQYLPRPGHCEFPEGGKLAAFQTFQAWVEEGTAPEAGVLR